MPAASIAALDAPGSWFTAANPSDSVRLAKDPSQSVGVLDSYMQYEWANYGKALENARADIQQALSAGVNTFNMLLPERYIPNSQFASAIYGYWQAASERPDFKMAVDIWWYGPKNQASFENFADQLYLLKSKYGSAWRLHNGKLVVIMQVAEFDFQANGLTPANLDTMFSKIGGRKNVFLVLYNPSVFVKGNPALYAAADAYTDWVEHDYAQTQQLTTLGAKLSKAAGKEYWYPVMPGFMQARPGITPNVREKLGVISFAADWKKAIAANAPAVNLTTWNDLTEDSSIKATYKHNYAFAEMSFYYSLWFKRGSDPGLFGHDELIVTHHPQVTTGMKLPAGEKVMPSLSLMGKPAIPATDYISAWVMLNSPAVITVKAGNRVVASKKFPKGVTQLLVYTRAKDTPNFYDYPSDKTPGMLITIMPTPLTAGKVVFAVEREGKPRLNFETRMPIVDTAKISDLTTVGSVFKFAKE